MWLWTHLLSPAERQKLTACLWVQGKTVSLPVPGACHSKLVLAQHTAQTHASLLASCSRSSQCCLEVPVPASLCSPRYGLYCLSILMGHGVAASAPLASCSASSRARHQGSCRCCFLFPSHVYATVGAWICLIWQSEMAGIWVFPGLREVRQLRHWVPAARRRVKQCLAWAALL